MSEASPTRPGRILFIHSPVIKAAGMVTTIVNMPQELSLKAITTTLATPAKRNDDDEERGQRGRRAGNRSQQPPRDLGQREPIAAHGGQQDHEVMHAAGQARADDDPGEAGQESPLRREHRPHQRPRPGNRREVNAEEHQPPRRLVVDVIAEPVRGREPLIIEHRDPRRQKGPIEPIGDGKGCQGGDDEPEGVHGEVPRRLNHTAKNIRLKRHCLMSRTP